MLTLQPRQRVGHDILLARHGNHISQMRLDRTNDCVIALLDDGTVDSAPNLISPLLEMPETLRSISRSEWRTLGVAAAAMVAVGIVSVAMAMVMLGGINDPELRQIALSYQAY